MSAIAAIEAIPTIRDHARATAQLFHPHVACNPAFGKACYTHKNHAPGVYGDYSARGVTGYTMHPVKGSLLRFIDIDDLEFYNTLLTTLPRLADTYNQTRGDHAAMGVILAYALDNAKLKTVDGRELASLRGPGLYQIGAGSVHPNGESYQGNGKLPIVLTVGETAQLAQLFDVGEKSARAERVPLPLITPVQSTDNQVSTVWKWIEGYAADADAMRAGRNDGLNERAYQAGRLARYVNADERIKALFFNAAVSNGYVAKDGATEALRTIASGFEAGKAAPRYPFTARRSTESPNLTVDVAPATTTPVDNVPLMEQTTTAPAKRRVSDGVRSAALYCSYDTGLIVYEATCAALRVGELKEPFYPADLIEAIKRLALGVSKTKSYEGLTRESLGADIFFRESNRVLALHDVDHKTPLLESRNNSAGRQKTAYVLRSESEIRLRLLTELRTAVLRKHFPSGGSDELLPVLEKSALAELMKLLDLPESDLSEIADRWAARCNEQKQDEKKLDAATKALRAARRDFIDLRNRLKTGESTPLPSGWTNGSMYRRIFRRAHFEANPGAQNSYQDHARLYGINAASTPALLKNAGLENDKESQFVERELDPNRDIDQQLLALRKELRGNDYAYKYDRSGVAVAAKFRVASKQKAVSGAVKVPEKRERKITTPIEREMLPDSGNKPTPKPRIPRPLRRSLNARWFEQKLRFIGFNRRSNSDTLQAEVTPMYTIFEGPDQDLILLEPPDSATVADLPATPAIITAPDAIPPETIAACQQLVLDRQAATFRAVGVDPAPGVDFLTALATNGKRTYAEKLYNYSVGSTLKGKR